MCHLCMCTVRRIGHTHLQLPRSGHRVAFNDFVVHMEQCSKLQHPPGSHCPSGQRTSQEDWTPFHFNALCYDTCMTLFQSGYRILSCWSSCSLMIDAPVTNMSHLGCACERVLRRSLTSRIKDTDPHLSRSRPRVVLHRHSLLRWCMWSNAPVWQPPPTSSVPCWAAYQPI